MFFEIFITMSLSEALHYEVVQHVLVRVCICTLGQVLEIPVVVMIPVVAR